MAQAQPRSIHEVELPRLDGKPAKLSDYAGKVVLAVNVASKCGFTPQYAGLQKLYDTYSDRNFVVVALNVDADRNRVAPFMKRLNISIPVYYAAVEDASVVNQMTAMGIPSTFLLGTDRTILDHQVGYAPQYEDRWKQVVEKHLKARK